MLKADKINLVGEFHSESDARRDAEKKFCLATVKNPNYWVEHLFPDVYDGDKLANLPGAGTADLMEYRGAHGAALAIEKFDGLGKDAITASTTSVNSVAEAISELNGKVKKVVEFALSVKKRSLVTTTVEVNTAVQAVYKEIADACRAYNDALRNASPDAQLAAARALADSRATVGGRVPALATAVGVTLVNAHDAAELAKVMRKQRSAFMGVGAEHSGLLGVWKIGNAHITDLQDGTAKVDLRKVNVVTRDEFEVEFQAWRG